MNLYDQNESNALDQEVSMRKTGHRYIYETRQKHNDRPVTIILEYDRYQKQYCMSVYDQISNSTLYFVENDATIKTIDHFIVTLDELYLEVPVELLKNIEAEASHDDETEKPDLWSRTPR